MLNDPYAILGVSKDAGDDEIKEAYRQCVRKYHPDLNPDDPDANDKMCEINEAYDLIMQLKKQHPICEMENYEDNEAEHDGNNDGVSDNGCLSFLVWFSLSQWLIPLILLDIVFLMCKFFFMFAITTGIIAFAIILSITAFKK